jgi:hypothetical protein
MKYNWKRFERIEKESFVQMYLPFFYDSEYEIELSGESVYLIFREHGVDCVADNQYNITSAIFHSEGHEGYRGYSLNLPHGLSFDLSNSEVQRLLGSPIKINKEIKLINFPYGEVYNKDNYNVSLHYPDDKKSILYCQIGILPLR